MTQQKVLESPPPRCSSDPTAPPPSGKCLRFDTDVHPDSLAVRGQRSEVRGQVFRHNVDEFVPQLNFSQAALTDSSCRGAVCSVGLTVSLLRHTEKLCWSHSEAETSLGLSHLLLRTSGTRSRPSSLPTRKEHAEFSTQKGPPTQELNSEPSPCCEATAPTSTSGAYQLLPCLDFTCVLLCAC